MKSTTKTSIFAALSAVLAFGAVEAYAAENVLVSDTGTSKTWIYTKTAVTPEPALTGPRVVRTEDVPGLVVPLNVDSRITAVDMPDLSETRRFSTTTDLRGLDLVEDDPLFIGASSTSEYDDLEAQRLRAGYSRNLGIDPLVPVAGAGLNTNF